MIVVKLGGAALQSTLDRPEIAAALAGFPGACVVVHGGGPEINRLSEKLGVESKFLNGQRVTSPEVLEVAEMVLVGRVNPAIVRGITRAGRPAIGLSGASEKLLECTEENPELGLVGKVTRVNTRFLKEILVRGTIPVVAPIGLFADGRPCNVNADLAAAQIALELKADRLLFLTDKDGILDAGGNTLSTLSPAKLRELMVSDVVSGGMKVKARAILEFLEGVPQASVEVMNGQDAESLAASLKGQGRGTRLSSS